MEQKKKKKSKLSMILMSLAAIIVLGVVAFAIIAVPNFQRFQRKAKQSEAKSMLAVFYSAQMANHIEYEFYVRDIKKLGFDLAAPERYVVGFSEQCRTDQGETLKLHITSDRSDPGSMGDILKTYESLPCESDFKNSFTAYAVGHIGGSQLDIWKINQDRELVNIQNGLR